MTKGLRYAQQIILNQAGTMKIGLSLASFRVIRGRVIRVSLYISIPKIVWNRPNFVLCFAVSYMPY